MKVDQETADYLEKKLWNTAHNITMELQEIQEIFFILGGGDAAFTFDRLVILYDQIQICKLQNKELCSRIRNQIQKEYETCPKCRHMIIKGRKCKQCHESEN